MSDFHLIPVAGGAPVQLPLGETVLGRGPFLGVSDKRVSRQHALLKNLRGRLSLKPTHLNPCFLRSSLSDDPRPLSRDSWVRLQDGDILSLLPGQLLFRVEEVEEVDGATHPIRNSQILEEEEERPCSPEPDMGPPHDEEEEEEKEEEDCPDSLNQEVEEEQRAMKTRVLPAWMMAAVAAPHSSVVQSTVKRSRAPAAAKQAMPPATDSPGGAGLSEEEEEKEERPRKKKTRKDDPSEEPTVRQVSDESEGFAMETGGDTPTEDVSVAMPTPALGGSEKENRKSVSVSSSRVRTPCPYGTDCYRKNPLHFQECSHPGDPDHEEEDKEDEEDRPECPYGTDCYRKNPLHRKEYRHTQRPARATRAATRSPAHEEDEDSFIDDDSEDAGSDSDYVPPDLDDSGEEDVKRLQREAQLFLKRRK
ncbi:aprataxin and PNK-like factor isoform X2 [Scophthalmus maximus]|uniref:aprataxin and PNK-like factor isoform X2 n=1 Tax=Scophthalmus maximus TaxID=52904 RepID=UPI001FA8E23C|nr:aprataxin and PNK-like factor isoform X2 [Scophthalmus maximus]